MAGKKKGRRVMGEGGTRSNIPGREAEVRTLVLGEQQVPEAKGEKRGRGQLRR